MFKVDKIDQNGREFSTLALCTLHGPYITPGLLRTGFNNFLGFFYHTVRLNKFFKNLPMCFIWLTAKRNKVLSFKLTMVNFF